MEDREILDLLFARSQEGVKQLSQKYGKLFFRLAKNILGNDLDAEECVNDAYLGAWGRIPPERPEPLLPYLCKIVRNLSLKRYRWNTASKRNAGMDTAYDELEGCLASTWQTEAEQDARELKETVEGFLDTLSKEDRILFLRRYWFADSHADIAARLGITENNAAVRLSRIRNRLRKYLKEHGVME